MSKRKPILFSTAAYEYLQRKMLKAGDAFSKGKIERKKFPDGELYQRILTQVNARDVFILGGTICEADTLELFDLACAIVKLGAKTLTIVVPYYGYSTMERSVKAGEVVTAKTRARLLSAIPRAREGNRVVLFDLHAEGIPHYFEGDVTAFHVYGKAFVKKAARRLAGGKDFVLASTDAGRLKWVQSLAEDLQVDAAAALKKRVGDKVQLVAVAAQVKGKFVVIYDDMIRTGGSLIQAAQAYKDAGAIGIAAICTHGIFPGEALKKLKDSGLFTQIVCTDSHPRVLSLKGEFLKVETVAGLLVDQLTHGLKL